MRYGLIGEKIEYTIVGSTEVNLAENRISNESPLGSALLGAKKNNKNMKKCIKT